jgi:hypothetical protein
MYWKKSDRIYTGLTGAQRLEVNRQIPSESLKKIRAKATILGATAMSKTFELGENRGRGTKTIVDLATQL